MRCEDPQGAFRVRRPWLQAGAEVTVEVRADGHAPATARGAVLPAPAADQFVFRLQRGVRVDGTVRDAATRAPIAGVMVALVRDDRDFRFQPGGVPTDADGRFRLDNVAAGPQSLLLRADGYVQTTFGPFDAALVQHVEPLLERGVDVRGRIVGATPGAGLRVRALDAARREAEATVGADGSFVLHGVAPGPVDLWLVVTPTHWRLRKVDVGREGIDVELPLRAGTGAIRAAILGAPDGELRLARIGGGDEHRLRFADGACLVDGLQPGRYRLAVAAQDGRLRGEAEAEVEGGEAAVSIECRERR